MDVDAGLLTKVRHQRRLESKDVNAIIVGEYLSRDPESEVCQLKREI